MLSGDETKFINASIPYLALKKNFKTYVYIFIHSVHTTKKSSNYLSLKKHIRILRAGEKKTHIRATSSFLKEY